MQSLMTQSETVRAHVNGSMETTASTLDRHFTGLREGLASLNDVLGKLGEKQIVIQTPEPPRVRSGVWGLFRRKNGAR